MLRKELMFTCGGQKQTLKHTDTHTHNYIYKIIYACKSHREQIVIILTYVMNQVFLLESTNLHITMPPFAAHPYIGIATKLFVG